MNKIKLVNRIFNQVDKHVADFKEKSCLKCLPDCGDCCIKPDIEATILEFLPAAYQLYLTNEYEELMDRINQLDNSICVFYSPFQNEGFCSHYKQRGLVCRLFGFSSKQDKNGTLTLVTCKKIKDTIKEGSLEAAISTSPEMSSYYLKLFGVDPKLAISYLPINEAIKKAIEIVLMHFQYKKKPA